MYVIGCVCVWQGRALTALAGDTETDTVKFLAGTQSVRNDNQIHEINYDQETDKASTRVFAFPQGQIWWDCVIDFFLILFSSVGLV
jgi:hypothetical protein